MIHLGIVWAVSIEFGLGHQLNFYYDYARNAQSDRSANREFALPEAEKPSVRKNISRFFCKWLFGHYFLREEL
jgi:hypothetical protein